MPSSSLLPSLNLAASKPVVKDDKRDDIHASKDVRSKDNHNIEQKDEISHEKDSNFDSWMSALITVVPTPTTVTPPPTSLESTLTVSLQTGTSTATIPMPLKIPTAAAGNFDVTTAQAPVTSTPEMITPLAANLTDDVASPANPNMADDLSPDQMKKFIDALNQTPALQDSKLHVVPSNANKDAINAALTVNPNLSSDQDAVLAMAASLQTRPTPSPAKGMDIRLNKMSEINLYAIETETPLESNLESPVASVKIATPETADPESKIGSAHSIQNSDKSFTSLVTTTTNAGLSSNGAATSQVGFTQTSTFTSPLINNVTPAQSHAATQTVAAIIQKNMKDGATGSQTISMRLDPVELGKMDIRMEYKKGEPLKVHLVVEKGDTMNMFLRDQNALETALNNAGIKSENLSLSFEHNQNAFDQAMNHNQGEPGQNQNTRTTKTQSPAPLTDIVNTNIDTFINPKTGRTHYNMTV